MPADNDYTFCTSSISAACYLYKSSALPYPNARAACKALGGDLVSYNSDDEQQTVSNSTWSPHAVPARIMRLAQPLPCRWRLTSGAASARAC